MERAGRGDDAAADVLVAVHGLGLDAGALVGTSNLTLQALSQQQNSIATYFPGVDLNNALNLTLSFDASAPIDAYASVIDNVSTDPIFVPAQQDAGVAASQ